jgi:hypothetical protein
MASYRRRFALVECRSLAVCRPCMDTAGELNLSTRY